MKYGKVSKEEVALKVYEPDSTVDAVVLCEYGEFRPDELKFHYAIRYKIFTKEGLDNLIMSIPVETKSAVRGMVFNMVDGKIVESKMKKESMYEERVIGSYSRMRIAPPDAREGSVIDISYSYRGLPSEWNFQKMIPVLWSELVIPWSEYYSFNKRVTGYEPLSEGSQYRWVAKDMPAFLPEPYISSGNNYMTTMFIEISEIHIPENSYNTGYHERFSTSWDEVSQYYYDHLGYGVVLRESAGFLNDAAEEVKSASATEKELVCNALDRIQADVKWNKRNRLFPTSPFREVYVKDKTGSSADMNFLFLKLLEKLDIDCYPMLLSTRSEGCINPMFPTLNRFNYTVSYVKIGDAFHVIDASDKYYGSELLKPTCLNGAAFLVTREKGEWVEIVPDKMSRKLINCSLSVAEDGFVQGKMQVQYADYAAASFRENQEDYTTQDEYLQDFEQDNPGIFVMDYEVENLDKNQGIVSEIFEVEIDGNTNVGAGLIHIDPVMMDRLEENHSPNDANLKEEIDEIRKMIKRTSSEIRRLSYHLHPTLLVDLGLEPALDLYFKESENRSNLEIEFNMVGFDHRLIPDIETVFYRFSQEALTNTLKHSGAETFVLSIIKSYPRIIFQAEDDGIGFDTQIVGKDKRSLGIIGMRERATLLGGTFQLRSFPGQGTRIRIEIPFSEESTHE